MTFGPKLRQSAVHRSLLTFQGFDQRVRKLQIVFQRKTTSANPLSRAHETNKVQIEKYFGLQRRGRFLRAETCVEVVTGDRLG